MTDHGPPSTPDTAEHRDRPHRRRTRWLLLGGVAAAAGVAILLVWFFGGSAPDEVDLSRLADDAAGQAGSGDADDDGEPGSAGTDEVGDDAGGDEAGGGEAGGEEAGDEDAGDAAEGSDADGIWVVDTDAVEFDGAEGRGSFVGYRVDEELATIGSTTAVGRTPAVDGRLEVADGQVTSVEVVADLTRLTSDESRRDGRVRSTLSADSTASFVLTEPFEPGSLGSDGEVVTTTVTGELTIEGVTHEVDVEVQATRIGEHVVVAGSTPIALSDYGIQAPSAPIVLAVADDAVVEWQLYLTRTAG